MGNGRVFSRLILGAVLVLVTGLAVAAVGRIEGTGSVSATGAATYEIPLRLPPGPNGIQPQLSLTYNSQQGDGLLGPGWAISGLPAITRCNKTVAQDGQPEAVSMIYNDAYCLDGKRLRITNAPVANYGQAGTTYDTEIAAFSQITAMGAAGSGPAYFILKAKNGLIYEFGSPPDSRVVPDTTSGTVYIWMLNKVSDRSGNNYVVTYTSVSTGAPPFGPGPPVIGVRVPSSISYAAISAGATTYTRTISFGYMFRPAANPEISGYVAGTVMLNNRLLRTISISISGTLSRRYTLTYDTAPNVLSATKRARLAKITECAGSAGTDCLAPTTISYQNGAVGFSPTGIGIAVGDLTPIAAPDLNGDGRSDIVYGDNATSIAYAALGSGTGVGAPIAIGSYSGFRPSAIATGDVAGLGHADVLMPQGGAFTLYRWNGTGFSSSHSGISVSADVSKSALMDINADGRPDLVTIVYGTSTNSFQAQMRTQLNSSVGGSLSFSASETQIVASSDTTFDTGMELVSGVQGIDFNGDGRGDLLAVSESATTTAFKALISNGRVFSVLSSTTPGRLRLALYNDDACTDIISGIRFVSRCNGGFVSDGSVLYGLNFGPVSTVDGNGDGRTDNLTISNNAFVLDTRAGNFPLQIPVPSGFKDNLHLTSMVMANRTWGYGRPAGFPITRIIRQEHRRIWLPQSLIGSALRSARRMCHSHRETTSRARAPSIRNRIMWVRCMSLPHSWRPLAFQLLPHSRRTSRTFGHA